MSEPEDSTRKKGRTKVSAASAGSRGDATTIKKSTGTRSSTSSSTPSTAPSTSSSSTSSDNSRRGSKRSNEDPAQEGSQPKNQLNLLASVSMGRKVNGAEQGGSDSGVSDEQDSQDISKRPQHQERESTLSGQKQLQQIPNVAAAPPENQMARRTSDEKDTQDVPNEPQHQDREAAQSSSQQPLQQTTPNVAGLPPEVEQMAHRIILEALQIIMNQPSDSSQPPHMMLIRQLAQHLANAGNTIVPPQPFETRLSGRSAAEMYLAQLSRNGNYQNSAVALNSIQQLQQLMMQQQYPGSTSNPPSYNPFANVAALLQQQNQLQLQNQLSSLLAMSQYTNPGLLSAAAAAQDPRPASNISIAAAAQNLVNPLAAMLNHPGVAADGTTATSATTSTTGSVLPASAASASAVAGESQQQQQRRDRINFIFEPTGRPSLPLATDSDEANLAPYQCLLRQQIELFETREDDIYLKAQGRNTPIRVGQVGIRCRHCAAMGRSKRVEGSAVLYSKSLNGIYQVALNMGRLHFLNNSCPMIPESTKKKLNELKELPRKVARGRQYWKENLEAQGVLEEQEYLRFKPL